MTNTPGAPSGESPTSVRVVLSDALIARFATLTGDQSSLHVDPGFARRSAYRRPVAHGMLAVGFLAVLHPLRREGSRCIPVALTGRFNAPAFAGDELMVTTGPERSGSQNGETVVDFRIENAGSRSLVTTGTLTVRCDPAASRLSASPAAAGAPRSRAPMTAPLAVRSHSLEQIEKGMADRIDFEVSDATLRDFIDILAEGVGESQTRLLADLPEQVHLPNLLAALLFSTSVGVSLPGASATFLEFSARLENDVALGTAYRLVGEVAHRSLGTRIIKKQLLVHPADRPGEVVVRGRVAALVNEGSRRMPTVEEMRGVATDWGLDGKVVLITGASRGIGETVAKLFSLFGARVIVNYHRGSSDAARVVGEITEAGGSAIAIPGDVTNPEAVKVLVEHGIRHYGGIDILVNNAVRDYRPVPFLQLSWDDIQKDIDVIAKGAFLCCQGVIPGMLERGGGKIINISTVAVDDPPTDQTKYVVAKSALVGLTRSLSIEYASKNIQVNMVVPNFVETDLVAHIPDGFRTKIADGTPMGRHASPIEVARAVAFLASAHSSFTTGQKIMVTGGGAPYL